MPTEVEARFRADRLTTLHALAAERRLGDAALGPVRFVDEVDRYLDTSDGRLSAMRWACRLRRRNERWRISLKGPPEPGADGSPDWLHARPEVEGPATESLDPAAWPASEARERLLEMSRGAPLEERLRLVQRRGERSVLVDGLALGILSLDEVRVADPRGDAGSLHIVELELAADRPSADLAEAARILAARPGLTPDPRTKLEHAIALLAR